MRDAPAARDRKDGTQRSGGSMKISVLFPAVMKTLEQAIPFASLAKFGGAHRLWQGQALGLDSFQMLAGLAGAGIRMPVGIGVTLFELQHPLMAAVQARSLANLTGSPVIAGFGPGATSFQTASRGTPYSSPLTASREYISIVRELLARNSAVVHGEYFTCEAGVLPQTTMPVAAGLGVLRPRMAQVAGECADAAITWLTPAHYLGDIIVPALEKGAQEAERPTPRLVAMVPLARERTDRRPEELALASNAGHFSAPHYQDMLRQSGASIKPSDIVHNARSAVDCGAFLSGSIDELEEQLRRYEQAGVDEVVLNVTGVCNLYGLKAAQQEMSILLRELIPQFGGNDNE